MHVTIAGIRSVYYPAAFAECTRRIPGAELVAAATAGRTVQEIRDSILVGPTEFAAKYGLRLYDDPVLMAQREGIEAAYVCAEPSRAYELVGGARSRGCSPLHCQGDGQ